MRDRRRDWREKLVRGPCTSYESGELVKFRNLTVEKCTKPFPKGENLGIIYISNLFSNGVHMSKSIEGRALL